VPASSVRFVEKVRGLEARGAVMLGDEMIDEASHKMARAIVATGRTAGLPSRMTTRWWHRRPRRGTSRSASGQAEAQADKPKRKRTSRSASGQAEVQQAEEAGNIADAPDDNPPLVTRSERPR
jgi:hypothetical protein